MNDFDGTTLQVLIVGNGDDWEGAYINGKLVTQDHKIRVDKLLEALGYDVDYKYTAQGWLEGRGELPEYISDVEFEEN